MAQHSPFLEPDDRGDGSAPDATVDTAAGHLPDLIDELQVDRLVRRFYGQVAQDDLLGPIFNDVAQVDWAAHIPKLTAFWCRALFGQPGYEGNPYREHVRVNELRPFTDADFDRWLEMFTETVDEGWEGPLAERIKDTAQHIGAVHRRNIVGQNPLTFVRR